MSDFAFGQGNVSTNDEKQLDEFNTYLASRTYVNGFAPSKEDVVAYKNFVSAPAQKYPHIVRWYKQIASIEDKDNAIWSNQSQDDVGGRGDDFILSGSESKDDEEKERFHFAVTTSFDIETLKKSDSELAHSSSYERQWLLPGSEYWSLLQTGG